MSLTYPQGTVRCPECKTNLEFETLHGIRIIRDGKIEARCPKCRKDRSIKV